MHVSDNLHMGGMLVAAGILPLKTASANPTVQQGVGPLGRVFAYDIVPLTIQTASLAVLQAPTNGTGLTLVAGTGITLGTAPDGSGVTTYFFDVPRAVSLTSGANLSAINFLITGYDNYGRRTTQLQAGPNNNTVNTLKTFAGVISVVPQGTSASTVSVGSSDIFGLPYVISDAGYAAAVKWNNTLAQDAGTLVLADATSPATSATGDPRGTYKPSANASNGARRLVFLQIMKDNQVGTEKDGITLTTILGVTPV